MRLLVISIILVACTLAFVAGLNARAPTNPLLIDAATSAGGWGTTAFDGWPPDRFTGNASARVHLVSPGEVVRQCSDAVIDPSIEACSFGPPNEIYMPNPCAFPRADNYARLLCHEIAHLDGWPDTHPR